MQPVKVQKSHENNRILIMKLTFVYIYKKKQIFTVLGRLKALNSEHIYEY